MFILLLSRSVKIPKIYEYLTWMTSNFLYVKNVLSIYRNPDNSVTVFFRAENGEEEFMNINLKWKDIYGMEKA